MPLLERYNGAGWDPVSPPASNPSGIIPAYNNPPASPQLGQQYFDITLNLTRTWNGSGWSPAPPSAAPPSVGIANIQGVSPIPSASDHVHSARMNPASGEYGIAGPVNERRFSAQNFSAATATGVYTCPAGCIAFCYLYGINNGAAATLQAWSGPSAINFASAGSTQHYSKTGVAANTAFNIQSAPLDAGDTLYISTSVPSLNYYLLVWEYPNAKADGWVISKTTNLPAATNKIYQPAAGKSAHGIGYVVNIYTTYFGAINVASNAAAYWSQAGAAAIQIQPGTAMQVGIPSSPAPVWDMFTNSNDAMYFNTTAAGANFWATHQEY